MIRRWIEFAVLFVGVPVLFVALKQFGIRFPVVFILPAAAIVVLVLLRRDDGLNFELACGRVRTLPRREWLGLAARFAAGASALTLLLFVTNPDALLYFPKTKPYFWLMVMCCYPVFSVLAQGVIYRALYWRRYSCLFPEEYKIIAGAAVFAFAHLPYANVYALVFTFAGGLVFLSTYRRTRSNMFASIEHALFGDFLFTIGWGNFFFHGR